MRLCASDEEATSALNPLKDLFWLAEWDESRMQFQKLNQLKVDNPALWNGGYGEMPVKIDDGNRNVFSFNRTKDQNTVIGVINMSASAQTITLTGKEDAGNFSDVFTGKKYPMGEVKLDPWQYLIFIE